MSADLSSLPVIEWSPSGVTLHDPAAHTNVLVNKVSELAGKVRGKVILAVSRRASFVRMVRLPDVGKPEMAKILALQIPKVLPIEPNDAAYDFAALENKTSEGRLVLVAAVQISTLRQALEELANLGLTVVLVVPTALSSLAIAQETGQSPVAVVGSTGNEFTIDIVDGGGIKASRTVSNRDSLESEVARTFGSAGLGSGPVISTTSVRIPTASLSSVDPLSTFGKSSIDINIELPEIKSQRTAQVVQRKKNLALFLWVAALGVSAVVYDIKSEQIAAVSKVETKWASRLRALKETENQAKSRSSEIVSQRDNLEVAFEPKQSIGDVVTVITNLAPEKLWLTGLNAERGKQVTLRGTALSSQAVTAYLSSLGKQNRMRDVKLVFANNGLIETTPVVNFSISAHVIGNFPLADEKTAKGGKS